MKPDQLETDLKKEPNNDEEFLVKHDGAEDEQDVRQVVAAEFLGAEYNVLICDTDNSDQVLATENSPKHKPVDAVDTVPANALEDMTNDKALEHQALPDLTMDEARGNQAARNGTYSGGNHNMAAEDQDLAAEDQLQTGDLTQDDILGTQASQHLPYSGRNYIMAAEDQDLAAEDQIVAAEVQCVTPIQQDLVEEDLAREVQHIPPIQQDLVA